MLEEGWYLMSAGDVEVELARLRNPAEQRVSAAQPLTRTEALAYRDAGNLPDEAGRTLRLVLRANVPGGLEQRRLDFEPDYHAAPLWRRRGSKPVNIIPLENSTNRDSEAGPWWDEPQVKALEDEWRERGTIAGVRVPGELRSFVHKPVLSLRAAGKEITADAIADSIARWVSTDDAERIRRALREANP